MEEKTETLPGRNAKCKCGGRLCILGTPVVRKFRNYPAPIYHERPQRGFGLSRWAVKKLPVMQWPHGILFEPDQKNSAKKESQAIKNTRQKPNPEGEFIPCNGMKGNFRPRCVSPSWLGPVDQRRGYFLLGAKESDKTKGRERRECKM